MGQLQATVWTTRKPFGNKLIEAKCIFSGEINEIPRVGDHVVVCDGFCAERVEDVIFDFVRNEVEIRVATCDPNDEYPTVDF